MDRRRFLGQLGGASMVAATSVAAHRAAAHMAANEQRVGGHHGGQRTWPRCWPKLFAAQADVDIPYICEVDRNVAGPALQTVEKAKGKTPQLVEDIRTVLDDKSIDAIVVATPVHWHAAGDDPGLRGGQGCLCGEADVAQRARGPLGGRGGATPPARRAGRKPEPQSPHHSPACRVHPIRKNRRSAYGEGREHGTASGSRQTAR